MSIYETLILSAKELSSAGMALKAALGAWLRRVYLCF